MEQSTQESQPNQPQVTTIPKSHNWKKVGLTVLVILVVTGIITGAYWFFVLGKSSVDSDLTGPVPKVTTKIATELSKAATPSAEKEDKTKLTNSYTDSFYKISFNYLDTWGEKTKSGIEACEPSVGPKNVVGSGLSICEFGLSTVSELADLPGDSASKKKNVTVAGKSGIRQVVTENGEAKVYAYVSNVSLNGQIGTLTVIGWPKGSGLTISEFIELFDKVLNTFKF